MILRVSKQTVAILQFINLVIPECADTNFTNGMRLQSEILHLVFSLVGNWLQVQEFCVHHAMVTRIWYPALGIRVK